MENKRSKYRDHFNYFVSLCMSTFSLGIAIYALEITGGTKTMTQPLPPIVLGMFGVAFICFILAIWNWINMLRTPEDSRLDDLIKTVKELKPKADLGDTPDLTSITKEIDKLKKLQTDLNDFFEHLPQHDTIQKK